MTVSTTFVGSGDAFGSGGRLQTCIVMQWGDKRLAVDFGATSMVGLRQQQIDPNSIDAVVLTHLHGDHCGGVPFLLLDAMLGSKRRRPLTIAGPAGTQAHLASVQEALFPGSAGMQPAFDLHYATIVPGQAVAVAGVVVRAVSARHTEQTQPLALSLDFAGTVVCYTGDGEYTEQLHQLVDGADLLIAECYFYDKEVKWHMNYPDIQKLPVDNIVLTHMHTNMLAHAALVPQTCAYDGLQIEV